MEHLNREQLEAGLPRIKAAPADGGRVEMIVIRPATDERRTIEACRLTAQDGCEGDDWRQGMLDQGLTPDPETQITLMNARCTDLLAGGRDGWALAGDQLYVDLDVSKSNLPAGQKLSIGGAVLQISAEPHTGCSKFAARYGVEAVKFVNLGEGAGLRLRGVYARVVEEGEVTNGDLVRKL